MVFSEIGTYFPPLETAKDKSSSLCLQSLTDDFDQRLKRGLFMPAVRVALGSSFILKLFFKKIEMGIFPNSSNEASTTVMPKLDKNTTTKEPTSVAQYR